MTPRSNALGRSQHRSKNQLVFNLHCRFADGLLTAAKGIRIDMFAPQNNVALKWRRLSSSWLYVYENVLIG